jgi:hypothetical protein
LKEAWEVFRLKSPVRAFAKHKANAMHKLLMKTYVKEINEEVRYKLDACKFKKLTKWSFESCCKGEASVETKSEKHMLNGLDITVCD